MSPGSRDRLFPRLWLVALLVSLACSGESLAQKQKPPDKKPPQKKDPVKQAADQQVKFNEAEALREAYILMAAANNAYAGHRGKAMNQVQAAVKLLDKSVLKKGTTGQKAAT